MSRKLKPPFKLTDDYSISDGGGHVLTAQTPEIAQTLLAWLNRTMVPASPEKHVLTPERVLNWLELSLLRVRDSERKRSVSHDPVVRVLTEICNHLVEFRKEFNEHG